MLPALHQRRQELFSVTLPCAGVSIIQPALSRGRGAVPVGQGAGAAAQRAGWPAPPQAQRAGSAGCQEPCAAPAQCCWPGREPALHAGPAELAGAGQRGPECPEPQHPGGEWVWEGHGGMLVSAMVKVVLSSLIWFLKRKDLMSRVCVATVICVLGDYQLQIAGMEKLLD